MTSERTCEITKDNLQSLETLFRSQFLDIGKIIELFDSKKAQEFKKMNQIYFMEDQGSHSHGHGGCSHTSSNSIYIPADKQTIVCKIISEKLLKSKTFFTNNNHNHLYNVLFNIDAAK
jgi:hypothetical protein